MTLEAGKEMDKRCVLNWLNEVYFTPSRAFNEYTDDELKMFAHDAIVLLKEQETELCDRCGRTRLKSKWEGGWIENERVHR